MKYFVWKKKCVNKNYIPNEMQIFNLIQLQKKDDNKKIIMVTIDQTSETQIY